MEDIIRLVEAMGFWGWMAVIACTAIITNGVVTIRKARYRAETGQAQEPDIMVAVGPERN